ncbi:MAG: rhodanese-like domain-containing protein [Ignavibacteriales bacterium]|nr:rhodanese-like domain-containing protein [Ignavibacteriales bacterium]
MTGEILFYAIIGLLVLISLRRFFVNRSVTHYSVKQVEDRIQTNLGVLLLDVRTEKEWRQGHIKGAHHIPLHELTRRSSELDKHKNREIICYCQTGNRSISAALRLKRLGFSTASMKGGIAEWNFQNRS